LVDLVLDEVEYDPEASLIGEKKLGELTWMVTD
jgi:hypothetical protein